MEDKVTKDWALYEAGKQYNQTIVGVNDISYYDMVDSCLAFYGGNQWRNVLGEDLPKPVFNFIKRTLSFFIASITSTNIAINFEKLEYSEEEDETVEMINAEVKNILEKMKIENRTRELLFDAGITGDACLHFYFDPNKKVYKGKGQIVSEIVDGSNVMFGNANNSNVEAQPYIIITGRDIAKNLQEEAKEYKESTEVDTDTDYEYMPDDNGKIEVETDDYGKALYILKYYKKKIKTKVNKFNEVTGMNEEVEEEVTHVFCSKSVKKGFIYQDIDTGYEYYPIAWLNWEKQKSQYHGKGIVIDMIPNQISINKMFAMVIYHLMLTSFPTAIYNADKVSGWSSEIGAQIELTDMETGDSIRNVAGYLEPASMSGQIINAIDMAIKYTKESVGVSDAAIGSVDPKNTSAIIAVQKSSVVPLENIKSNLYEFVEDVGRILLDIIGTKYGKRTVLIEDKDGNKISKDFDFSTLKDQWLNVRADVGSSAYYSEVASLQTLDNLLMSEKIDFVQYLERIPKNLIPDSDSLIEELKQRMGILPKEKLKEYENMAQFIETLPIEEQNRLKSLPDAQMEEEVTMMMQQPQNNINEENKLAELGLEMGG